MLGYIRKSWTVYLSLLLNILLRVTALRGKLVTVFNSDRSTLLAGGISCSHPLKYRIHGMQCARPHLTHNMPQVMQSTSYMAKHFLHFQPLTTERSELVLPSQHKCWICLLTYKFLSPLNRHKNVDYSLSLPWCLANKKWLGQSDGIYHHLIHDSD